MWRIFEQIRRIVLLAEDAILALLLGTMVLLAGGQILLRNLFDSGIVWADPALRLLVLWITMMGVIAASREDRHIRIDLFSRFLNPRLKLVAQGVTDLFSALVCGLITWHAARFVYFEWQDGNELFGQIPAWLGEIIIPIGFAVLTLRFLLNMPMRYLRREADQ
jgi:TRAP-type C4-dicarboxylate transport system permease small subunit